MPSTYSPLRYPGGKTKFYNYVRELLRCNNMLGETYMEPFAGGAGLALKLLLNNDVKRIIINDYDTAIYSFWHSILYESIFKSFETKTVLKSFLLYGCSEFT